MYSTVPLLLHKHPLINQRYLLLALIKYKDAHRQPLSFFSNNILKGALKNEINKCFFFFHFFFFARHKQLSLRFLDSWTDESVFGVHYLWVPLCLIGNEYEA